MNDIVWFSIRAIMPTAIVAVKESVKNPASKKKNKKMMKEVMELAEGLAEAIRFAYSDDPRFDR